MRKRKFETSLTAAVAIFLSMSHIAWAADSSSTKANASSGTAKSSPKSAAKAGSKKATTSASGGKISESRALDLVMAMPEVKEFFKTVKKSNLAKPTIDLDRKEGNNYVVHVYEVVTDGPDSSHTATKNWYYVNINTGKITKEF